MSLDNHLSYECGQRCEFQVFGQRCEFQCLDNNVSSSVWTTMCIQVFGKRDFECLDNVISSVWSGDNDVSLEWGQ